MAHVLSCNILILWGGGRVKQGQNTHKKSQGLFWYVHIPRSVRSILVHAHTIFRLYTVSAWLVQVHLHIH